ncbi:uncharacterized protein LOC107802847 [Nicotiana tabacum]|uniref:Protein E6-like n=1 Tax=Nicotiana tabacum TaxID=4097 RepID=A0A1S4AZ13_TOBAC|nr:PREDICTED: protein E6-like [Nicotiana tabacum]
MAFLANHLSFFLLITLLSSLQIHARDNKFFNKISTTNNGREKETKEGTPNKEQEPNFIPENENGYGVYDHESGQLSPSTTNPTNNIPNSKYLPKNYNPVAYVIVPQDNPNNNNDDNNNNNYNQYCSGDHNTYDNEDNNNQYYSGGSTYNHNQYHNGGSNYNYNNNYPGNSVGNSYYNDQEQSYPLDYNHYDGDNGHRVQQQRMSDTRFLENGKYSYEVNTEKYVRDPYENSREFANSYADNELSNYNNVNFVKYENEEEFQPEGDMP